MGEPDGANPSGKTRLGAVVGVAAGLLVVVPALIFLTPPQAAPPESTATPTVVDPGPADPPSVEPSEPAVEPDPEPEAGDEAAAGDGAGVVLSEEGIVVGLPVGSYTTLFKWMPKATTTAAEAAEFAAGQSRNGLTVVAIDGDSVNGLEPGRYGIGVVGLGSFKEAQTTCGTLGFRADGQTCWARPVKA